MNYLTERSKFDDMLEKRHWKVLEKLLVFGEDPIEEVQRMIADLEDFGMNEPEFIIQNALLVTSSWLTEQYILLRSEDLFPDDFSFVVDISVEEALAIREGEERHDELVEDYYTTVADIYSYGGYGTMHEMPLIKKAIAGSSSDDISLNFIEEDIAACMLEILIQEGWFIIWDMYEEIEVVNEPFQPTW